MPLFFQQILKSNLHSVHFNEWFILKLTAQVFYLFSSPHQDQSYIR